MPVSPYFKSLSAKVAVPGEDDPVDVRQVGENTYMDFGIDSGANIGAARSYARQMDGRRPLTQSEIGADALLRAQLGVPDQTLDFLQYGPATTPGLEPLEMPFSDIKKRNLSRPQQSYGLNRGGTGKAGRVKSPQLGNTQFDMPGLEPFEMLQSDLMTNLGNSTKTQTQTSHQAPRQRQKPMKTSWTRNQICKHRAVCTKL